MKDYKLLAIRYLKQNKGRSLITILGTTLTVLILYSLLNVGWGYLLQVRQDLRESQDYEFVLFTETEEQITDILADSRVKSAYVGPYYSYHNGTGVMYENALYINTFHPYRLDYIFQRMCLNYDVDGEIHNELAWTYLQGSDGSFIVVVIYFSILVAFIFAIIGVGIIRSSIQMSMFENIRDYGNLRCIGSSKRQLKGIIYLQGMILEIIGIAAGILLGSIGTIGISRYFHAMEYIEFQGGFHLLPSVLILAVFFVDLYFAMGENAKLVTKMSPVSAVRGEYQIRQEKFRLREKNPFRILLSKLFSIDGEYAFQSVMRNPRRFWRTVWAFVFGIAAFIGIESFASSVQTMMNEEMDEFRYYQVYVNNLYKIEETIQQVEASLPSVELLQEISDLKEVTEARRCYSAQGYVAELDELYNHYSEEYMSSDEAITELGIYAEKEMLESHQGYTILDYDIGVTCYGYDESDLERYRSALMDGTVDLDENGVILVNPTYESEPYFSYQVGDTIRIVDIGKMHERLDDMLVELNTEYFDMYELDLAEDPEDLDSSLGDLLNEYYQKKYQAIADCWMELAEEGCYKTYVIEGIVSEDVNVEEVYGMDFVRILMTQETYFDLTGTTAKQPTGMLYHLDKPPKTSRIADILGSGEYIFYFVDGFIVSDCDISGFIYYIEEFGTMNQIIWGISLAVLFIVVMALLNTINAVSGSLHLRRREFAQLRVIGVSKKHLMRMVMLEGIITAATAGIIGTLLGFVLSYGLFLTFTVLYGVSYHFPFYIALAAILIFMVFLCGAMYVPMRSLNHDLVSDLQAGGD